MKDLLEYALARSLEAGIAAMPGRGARAAGGLMGRLAHHPLAVRREVVTRHLARAFPGRGEAWVEATARRCYLHFGREVGTLARARRLDPDELVAGSTGADRARRVLRSATGGDPPGVLVVTGHLGNWELAGAYLAGLGLDVSAVVRRQKNRRIHRRLVRLRRGLGVEPVTMSAAGRRIPEALSEGGVVALVADQDAGSKGVFVPFLGRRASTFRGPARLAREHRVPLVFGALVREAGGYRSLARTVWSPDAGRDPPDEDALTRAWVAELECAVRKRSEQYFWFHRRWKTRPGPDPDRS